MNCATVRYSHDGREKEEHTGAFEKHAKANVTRSQRMLALTTNSELLLPVGLKLGNPVSSVSCAAVLCHVKITSGSTGRTNARYTPFMFVYL